MALRDLASSYVVIAVVFMLAFWWFYHRMHLRRREPRDRERQLKFGCLTGLALATLGAALAWRDVAQGPGLFAVGAASAIYGGIGMWRMR